VFELIQSGGLLMIPILFCSVMAMGIVGERFWTYLKSALIYAQLVFQILQ
jgi:biopolymer transport protein ExbB